MPSAEEKARRKQLAQQLQSKNAESFLAGLPIQLSLFQGLFNYLDKTLINNCDDTLRSTEQFSKENNIQFELLKTWLGKQGGYCDCEVLANVEEKFEGFL
ncbi:DUF2695 domain-containing protein [Hymenobacter arcticus]